jgi:hypothetical protein
VAEARSATPASSIRRDSFSMCSSLKFSIQ